MKKKIIALAVASALTLSACGKDDEPELTADERVASYTGDDAHEHDGTDSHATIDPVKEDPGIAATAVATSMFTWNPAQQVSVFHVSENVINEQLTGALAEQARDFDSEQAQSQTPDEWIEWAKEGVRIQAIIPSVEVTDDSNDDMRTIAADVQQFIIHPENGRSHYQDSKVIIRLVAQDGHWKAELMERV